MLYTRTAVLSVRRQCHDRTCDTLQLFCHFLIYDKRTSDFDDLCEDVVGHLLSILNGTDPPLDALSANLANGLHRLTIRPSFEREAVLSGEMHNASDEAVAGT